MIELTASQIDKAQRVLSHIPNGAPKAMSRAINRAADSARTEAARKVRETYYIGYSEITSTIKIYRASSENLGARVESRGHVLPLTKFKVTPNRPMPKRTSPIIVRVKRGEGGPIRTAFVARMHSGHLAVMSRAGKRRLPIQEHFGPPIPQMLGNPSVTQWVEQKAGETLEKRLEHEIDRMLED